MCSEYKVGLICGEKEGEDLGELKDWKMEFCMSFPNERPRTKINFLKSWMIAPSLNTFRNSSKEIQKAVNEKLDWADVLLVDHLEMMQFVPKNCKAKVVLHEHNAEHMLWQRKSEISSFPMSMVLELEAQRVQRFELASCERSAQVWAAPADQEVLSNAGIPKEKLFTTFHLGAEDLLDRNEIKFEGKNARILFFGTLSWDPNLEGLVWFLREIWPPLKARHAQLELDICGKGASSVFVSLLKRMDGVNYHGFVDDLEPFFQNSRLSIAPLNYGSGMKIKVVESLYRGLPCVTTQIGAESLDPVMDALSIAEDSEKFRREVEYLIEDFSLAEKKADLGRKLSREHLSWTAHWKDLKGYLSEL